MKDFYFNKPYSQEDPKKIWTKSIYAMIDQMFANATETPFKEV